MRRRSTPVPFKRCVTLVVLGAATYALRDADADADARDGPAWLLRTKTPAAREPERFTAAFDRLAERASKTNTTGRWALG